MQAFTLPELEQQRQATGRPYLECLRVPSLSLGLYELPAGGVDLQQPHTEDEVYCVTAGHARVTVADEERAVGPGSVVYVAAAVPHRFHSTTANLRLLVFFAPAEYTQAAA